MEQQFREIEENNDWNEVFQQIRNEADKFNYEYTNRESRKRENRDLNRYRDVTPYDHSRIRLSRGYDYINASLVDVQEAGRSYILTQGPLQTTIGHFWLMIWEHKSKAVLMLNGLVERGAVKCNQYWPVGPGHVMQLEDVELQMEKQAGSAKVDVKNVLIEMRRYRMGLIQTPEQLRFSFLAIIDGMKCLRPLSNGTAATDEEKPAAGEEEADVRQRKPAAAEQSQVSDASPANNNSAHERERQREERKRKTEETIKRIKDKSKELEQKSRFKSKILKLGLIGAVLLLGAGVLYGFFLSGRGPSPAIPHRPLQNLSH